MKIFKITFVNDWRDDRIPNDGPGGPLALVAFTNNSDERFAIHAAEEMCNGLDHYTVKSIDEVTVRAVPSLD